MMHHCAKNTLLSVANVCDHLPVFVVQGQGLPHGPDPSQGAQGQGLCGGGQRDPRLQPGADGQAQAGLHQAPRHGDGRQLLLPDGRRLRLPPHDGGEGQGDGVQAQGLPAGLHLRLAGSQGNRLNHFCLKCDIPVGNELCLYYTYILVV
jgi:hypothetical protein